MIQEFFGSDLIVMIFLEIRMSQESMDTSLDKFYHTTLQQWYRLPHGLVSTTVTIAFNLKTWWCLKHWNMFQNLKSIVEFLKIIDIFYLKIEGFCDIAEKQNRKIDWFIDWKYHHVLFKTKTTIFLLHSGNDKKIINWLSEMVIELSQLINHPIYSDKSDNWSIVFLESWAYEFLLSIWSDISVWVILVPQLVTHNIYSIVALSKSLTGYALFRWRLLKVEAIK